VGLNYELHLHRTCLMFYIHIEQDHGAIVAVVMGPLDGVEDMKHAFSMMGPCQGRYFGTV